MTFKNNSPLIFRGEGGRGGGGGGGVVQNDKIKMNTLLKT